MRPFDQLALNNVIRLEHLQFAMEVLDDETCLAFLALARIDLAAAEFELAAHLHRLWNDLFWPTFGRAATWLEHDVFQSGAGAAVLLARRRVLAKRASLLALAESHR